METRSLIRNITALALVLQWSGLPAKALVSVDDGKNQFFVVGTLGVAWDSNIFVNSSATGDYIYSASLGLEYHRRAGLITFNGSAFLDASQFGDNRQENFENPRFRGEFTKQSGRTTGSLTLGAAKQSRADTAANIRSESWDYDAGLNLKYPVIERYTLSGGISYSHLDFIDNSFLVDLRTYAAHIDLFYVYTSERDLVGGYRVRWGESSASTSFVDHAFTAGVSGKILPKVGGDARAGYQVRIPSGSNEDSYRAITASVAATWNATMRANLTLQGGKDFSTSSTNINIDGTSANLDLQYGQSAKITAFTGIGHGVNRFLGAAGAGRRDTYFTWNVGASYTLSGHFKIMLTYSHYRNRSNFAFSDFKRNSVNLNLSSRF
jgi:hypothetical protein